MLYRMFDAKLCLHP